MPSREGWIRLSEKDFNHYESFFASHPNIKPESVDEIYTRGIFETFKYPLIIIRHIDWLLKKDGVFNVDYCYNVGRWFGPYHQIDTIRYFIAIGFADRYILTTKEVNDQFYHFAYRKCQMALSAGDCIEKWTWGICSNGTKNERVLEMIQQINALKIPFCEIIVCGPPNLPKEHLPANVKLLDDSSIYKDSDIRIPITKKKNLIVEHSIYNNIIILHDRFYIPETWYNSMCRYGNYFDLLLTPVRVHGDLSSHTYDWQNVDNYNLDNPINSDIKENLPYDIYNENVFLNGGIIICKKNIYLEIKQSPKLNWEEMEDVDFSQRVTRNGYLVHLDINNYIESAIWRMGSLGAYHIHRPKTSFKDRLIYNKTYYRHFHESKIKYSSYAMVKAEYDIKMEVKYWFYRIIWWVSKHFVKI